MLRAAGARPDAFVPLAEDLLARWAEPHRRYHDLRHLIEVLDRIDELAAFAHRADLVRLAAWWHDAVHDGRAGADEQASADLAGQQLLHAGVDPGWVSEVVRLVLVTADHVPRGPQDHDAAVLCDADLGILAAAPDRYERYAADVRLEYAHVGDEAFTVGRSAVLRELAGRPRLFRTPGAQPWDQRARANLAGELDRLTAARR